MAINFINVDAMSRSNGANAVECSAYRSNSKMHDEQIGKSWDYTKKSDCVYAHVMLPETAFMNNSKKDHPFNNREKLWNAVEVKENSHNRFASAQVAFEVQLGLPKELTLEQNKKLLNEFIYDNYVSKYNVAADMVIHHKGDVNIHAHVMLTTRKVMGEELANRKERQILAHVRTNQKGKAFVRSNQLQKMYTRYQNKFFKENGIDLTVDQTKIHGNIHMRRSRLDGGFYKGDIEKNRDIDQRNLDEVSKDHNIIIDTLAKRQSTFTKADIEMLVLKCTVADNTKSQEVLDKVLSSKRLINLGYSVHGRETFTVKENYRKDIQLLELTSELSGRRGINVHQKLIDQTIAEAPSDKKLTEEQAHSLKHIAHNGNLSCIVGYAGAGKSHSLKYVHELYKKKDIKVYGVAISGKVAQDLESETGAESRTIESLLLAHKNQSKTLPDKGSVLIIEEAGMVGLDDMNKLMNIAKERDLKLVLVGDPNQLEAIDKGSPFKLIASEIGFAALKNIYRQIDVEDKKATINLAEGRIGDAIDHYNSKGSIHFESADRIFSSAVDKYLDYVKAGELEQTLALAHSKKDVHQLNLDIRNNLIESNKMSMGSNIDISIPKGFLQKNEIQSRRFAVGEKIVFLKNGRVSETEKVKNGLFAVITSIDKGIISVRTLEGEESSRELKVDLSSYNSIDYGYATTIHKAQGASVLNTIKLVNSKGNRNLTYVGMTRHKHNLDVYVNNSKYKDLDSLKRGLSSSSNKELNVLDFVRQIDRQGAIPSIKRLFGIESKDYVLSDESKANAKYQDVAQLVDINRDISRSYAELAKNSDNVDAVMQSKYEYRNQLAAKIVGNLDELMPAIHQNELDVADIHKWAKSDIAEKNFNKFINSNVAIYKGSLAKAINDSPRGRMLLSESNKWQEYNKSLSRYELTKLKSEGIVSKNDIALVENYLNHRSEAYKLYKKTQNSYLEENKNLLSEKNEDVVTSTYQANKDLANKINIKSDALAYQINSNLERYKPILGIKYNGKMYDSVIGSIKKQAGYEAKRQDIISYIKTNDIEYKHFLAYKMVKNFNDYARIGYEQKLNWQEVRSIAEPRILAEFKRDLDPSLHGVCNKIQRYRNVEQEVSAILANTDLKKIAKEEQAHVFKLIAKRNEMAYDLGLGNLSKEEAKKLHPFLQINKLNKHSNLHKERLQAADRAEYFAFLLRNKDKNINEIKQIASQMTARWGKHAYHVKVNNLNANEIKAYSKQYYLENKDKGESMAIKPKRVEWGDHFYPNIITHQNSSIRRDHSDYVNAKAGDNNAAMRIASDMLSAKSIEKLSEIIKDKDVTLVPVSSLEGSGVNKIPRAFANELSQYLGCDVDKAISQNNSPKRTGKTPDYRMKNQPLFEGEIKKGHNYILVDDHSSMGATFANLKGYIESNGGKVIAATAISARVEGLALDHKAINRSKQNINTKHYEKTISRALKQEMGYEFNYKTLTKGELGYITERIIERSKSDKVKGNTQAVRQRDESLSKQSRVQGLQPTKGQAVERGATGFTPTEKDKQDISFLTNIRTLEDERFRAAKRSKLLDNKTMMRHASQELIKKAKEDKDLSIIWQKRIDKLLDKFNDRRLTMSEFVKQEKVFKEVVDIQQQRMLNIQKAKEQQKSADRGFSI